MGRVVNFEKGELGSKLMAVEAPTTTRGAVSPMAREIARMVPVKIPGIAFGRTCDQTVCHLVAPTPKLALRSERGTARIASCPLMMIKGSTSKPKVRPPDSTVL